MVDQVKNFVVGTVSTGYDESATTIVLDSGHNLPNPSGDNYNVVWYDSTNFSNPALDPKVEIDRVTVLSTNTITITRAQESTSATTKNTSGATYKMILAPTAKTITDLQSEIDSDITTHTGLGDAHHAESHTIASHSDTTATGVELETLTDGSDADSLHAHAVNDAKVTNATHTGDVTGATALTIGADKVNDTHIDWGTGVNQVSAVDVPIADSGSIITATEIEGALQENRTAIDLNTAKDTNVSTDLSEGTSTETTVDVNSSDGTNATLVAASALRAGLLTKAKFDEIVVNNAKVTNATHSGEVTGSGALTITDAAVTYAKIQNVVNDDVFLGRISGADGDVEEISKANALTLLSVEDGADVTDAVNVVAAWLGEVDKNTPADNDTLPIADSAVSNVLKKVKWSNVKATLKTYFDTLYNLYSHPNHTGEVTSTGDGATVITADAVTYDKIQDTSATDKLLGRSTIGAGTIEEIACTAAGRAILDDADNTAQRTTLDVDQAGTDNSTDVTLAGTPDYITIAGQVITRNQVDLTADITGNLPIGNLNSGTGASSATYWRGDGTWVTPAGSGDVSKVGTPIDNQIGVWTGDGTIEGTAGLTYSGTDLNITGDVNISATKHLVLPLHDDAATPSLAFGDGDSGFYESADDALQIAIAGVKKWYINADYIGIDTRAQMRYVSATDINPNLCPSGSDTDTGIGRNGADSLSIIAGGVEGIRLTEAEGVITSAFTDNITVTGTVDGIDIATDVTANTAKVTNATHTGDVTGSGILTIASGAVDVAMLANSTDGELITWDAAGAPATVAVGTATHVLTSNGVGAAPTFQAVSAGAQTVNIYLPAESAYLPVTNPAELVEELGATTYGGFSYLTFDDTTSEHAIWRVPMPDYDGGNIVVTSFSKVASTPSGVVSGQYNILTIGLANSEEFDSADTADTGVNISHSLFTTELLTEIMVASATIDPANVAADDLLVIELSRDVVSDDLPGDLELVGIMLEYTRT